MCIPHFLQLDIFHSGFNWLMLEQWSQLCYGHQMLRINLAVNAIGPRKQVAIEFVMPYVEKRYCISFKKNNAQIVKIQVLQ